MYKVEYIMYFRDVIYSFVSEEWIRVGNFLYKKT